MLRNKLHFDAVKARKNGPCYICPLAKQQRLSFDSHNNMAAAPFDLIHCDIWGPYHMPSYSSHHYFVTLVDDYSCFTWIFLLQNKSDVATVFPKFFNMIAT